MLNRAAGTEEFGMSFSCPSLLGTQDCTVMRQALLRTIFGRVRKARNARWPNHDAFLSSVLEPLLARLEDADVWMPELGFVLHLHREGKIDAASAQLALALSAAQIDDVTWSYEIGEDAEMLFGGTLFVGGGSMRARISRDVAEIDLFGGSAPLSLRFVRTGALWQRMGTESPRICDPYLLASDEIAIYVNGFKTGEEMTSQVPLLSHGRAVGPAGIARHAEILSSALATIEQMGPDYVRWVGHAIKMVQMLDCWREEGDPVYTSSSWPSRPGMVSMGFSVAPTLFEHKFRVADSFIHEASHQYLNLLSLAFPLANGNDSSLYYSVLARRERPIDRVLLAFHAAANMALFYAEAFRRGRYECRHNFKWAMDCSKSLREPLDHTTGLTDVGLGIFRPLASALDEIDTSMLAHA